MAAQYRQPMILPWLARDPIAEHDDLPDVGLGKGMAAAWWRASYPGLKLSEHIA